MLKRGIAKDYSVCPIVRLFVCRSLDPRLNGSRNRTRKRKRERNCNDL